MSQKSVNRQQPEWQTQSHSHLGRSQYNKKVSPSKKQIKYGTLVQSRSTGNVDRHTLRQILQSQTTHSVNYYTVAGYWFFFSALTLSVGWQEGHPASKN